MNIRFSLNAGVLNRRVVNTYNWHVYILLREFLHQVFLLILKCHIDKSVNSGGTFNTFERLR